MRKIPTNLANNLDAVGILARYDAACKRILADKMVLAWILKSVVAELADYPAREIAEHFIEMEPRVAEVLIGSGETNAMITGMNSEDVVPHEGKITFDIRFYVKIPFDIGSKKLLVDIEAQNDFYPGYNILTRGIFYGCRMISAQSGTEFMMPDYDGIKKVYSIWICMNPPVKWKNTITEYPITSQNRLGEVCDEKDAYDKLTIIRICLGGAKYDNYVGIIRLLDVLFSEKLLPEEKKKILEQEFDIPMSRAVEKELREMCNFSEGIWKQGICAGIRWGRNEEKQIGAFALISTLLRYGLDEEQIRAELVRNRYAENYLELYKASR